jgi:hypothetical protein
VAWRETQNSFSSIINPAITFVTSLLLKYSDCKSGHANIWASERLLLARIPALRSFFSTPDPTQYSSRSGLSSYAGLPKITMARYNILVSLGIPSLSYCQIWWMVVLGCQWHTCLAESAGIYNPSPSISLNIDLLYESRPEIGLQPVAQGGTQ